MMDDIEEALESAMARMRSRAEFAEFLSLFLEDYDDNLEFWNNQDLRSFIAALKALAEATEHTAEDVDNSPPRWRVFAEMLCAARAYMVD
jgi:hypothetical protein